MLNNTILKVFQIEKGRNDLRITHEADYAIRVTYCLALAGGKQCAKDISETTGVTLRFALKILRKLTQSGITKSYKGVAAGMSSIEALLRSVWAKSLNASTGRLQSITALPMNSSVRAWAAGKNAIFIMCLAKSTNPCGSSCFPLPWSGSFHP